MPTQHFAPRVARSCLLALLLAASFTGGARAQDDSCQYSGDGECDEPRYCHSGTDCTDCGNCAPPDDTCRYSGDGECDEPRFCDSGTDCTDCHTCSGGGGGGGGGSGGGSTGAHDSCYYANNNVCNEPSSPNSCSCGTDDTDCTDKLWYYFDRKITDQHPSDFFSRMPLSYSDSICEDSAAVDSMQCRVMAETTANGGQYSEWDAQLSGIVQQCCLGFRNAHYYVDTAGYGVWPNNCADGEEMTCSSECAHAVSHYLDSCSSLNAQVEQMAAQQRSNGWGMTIEQEIAELIADIRSFATTTCESSYADAQGAAQTNRNALLVPTNQAAAVADAVGSAQIRWSPSPSTSSNGCIRTLMSTGSSTGEWARARIIFYYRVSRHYCCDC